MSYNGDLDGGRVLHNGDIKSVYILITLCVWIQLL